MPFMVASAITAYGVAKLQDVAVNSEPLLLLWSFWIWLYIGGEMRYRRSLDAKGREVSEDPWGREGMMNHLLAMMFGGRSV